MSRQPHVAAAGQERAGPLRIARAGPAHARGFTLLEMIVVLLIAGMAMALTFEVLGQYQRAHARAGASERAVRELRLGEAWFRDSVRGLYPATTREAAEAAATTRLDRAELEPLFEGGADGFTGVTLAPVLAGQGVPTVQEWRIRRENGTTRLVAIENDRELVLQLPRVRDLRLHYLDGAGKPHRQWPPAKGQDAQLPAAIVLELVRDPGEATALIAASVQGPRDRPDFLRYEVEEY